MRPKMFSGNRREFQWARKVDSCSAGLDVCEQSMAPMEQECIQWIFGKHIYSIEGTPLSLSKQSKLGPSLASHRCDKIEGSKFKH